MKQLKLIPSRPPKKNYRKTLHHWTNLQISVHIWEIPWRRFVEKCSHSWLLRHYQEPILKLPCKTCNPPLFSCDPVWKLVLKVLLLSAVKFISEITNPLVREWWRGRRFICNCAPWRPFDRGRLPGGHAETLKSCIFLQNDPLPCSSIHEIHYRSEWIW